ncbi:PREDICTED: chorion peroxidase-like, partial [Nicrophorus vespilloides]|uniref:Chorion peroxidase-like n=1 Tax=Nicrophorus vespilloides TaxID=110193 RepID=A0ABM1MRC6_NICVS
MLLQHGCAFVLLLCACPLDGVRVRRKLADPINAFVDVSKSKHHAKPHMDVCDEGSLCVLPIQCPAHFYADSMKNCLALGGGRGMCCSTGQNHTERLVHRKGRLGGKYIDHIDPRLMGAVVKQGRVDMAELHMKEARLMSSGRAAFIPVGSASYGHFRNTRVFSMSDLSEVMNVANRALEIALATRAFKDKQGLTNQQLEWGMVREDLRPTPLGSACSPQLRCPPVMERYRRIDGSCNNIFNPSWGTPLSPYARLLPPSYHD